MSRTLTEDGKLIVSIETRDKTDRTGFLDIGEHTDWLFTKKLFASEPLSESIQRLIMRTMIT